MVSGLSSTIFTQMYNFCIPYEFMLVTHVVCNRVNFTLVFGDKHEGFVINMREGVRNKKGWVTLVSWVEEAGTGLIVTQMPD